MSDANELKSVKWLGVVALLVAYASSPGAQTANTTQVKGMFKPDGPPHPNPVRRDAGKACVVDVEQNYIVTGSLSGSFDIDYRILVLGPCGSPIGTFAEEWIAHGQFDGALNNDAASASFTYTATVEAGGEVSGLIVLGQGLDGTLRIHGNFSEGELVYEGKLKAIKHQKEVAE